jgi:hypothetical protein
MFSQHSEGDFGGAFLLQHDDALGLTWTSVTLLACFAPPALCAKCNPSDVQT